MGMTASQTHRTMTGEMFCERTAPILVHAADNTAIFRQDLKSLFNKTNGPLSHHKPLSAPGPVSAFRDNYRHLYDKTASVSRAHILDAYFYNYDTYVIYLK